MNADLAITLLGFALMYIGAVGLILRVVHVTKLRSHALDPETHQHRPRDGDALGSRRFADGRSVGGGAVGHTHSNRSLRSRNHG